MLSFLAVEKKKKKKKRDEESQCHYITTYVDHTVHTHTYVLTYGIHEPYVFPRKRKKEDGI